MLFVYAIHYILRFTSVAFKLGFIRQNMTDHRSFESIKYSLIHLVFVTSSFRNVYIYNFFFYLMFGFRSFIFRKNLRKARISFQVCVQVAYMTWLCIEKKKPSIIVENFKFKFRCLVQRTENSIIRFLRKENAFFCSILSLFLLLNVAR